MIRVIACLFWLMSTSLLNAQAPAKIERVKGDAASPILSGVVVPSGTTLYYLSGQVSEVTDPSKPAGSIEQYGDTKTQTISTFTKIKDLLTAQGLGLGDIIKLTAAREV